MVPTWYHDMLRLSAFETSQAPSDSVISCYHRVPGAASFEAVATVASLVRLSHHASGASVMRKLRQLPTIFLLIEQGSVLSNSNMNA